MSTTSSAVSTPPASFPSPRWWVSDREGRLAVAHFPNPALAVWLVTVVIGWLHLVDRAATLKAIGQGALIVWALDELVRGTSPVRRLLGAVVLAFELVSVL